MTSALDGGEWSASRPGRALHPGKGPLVPIVQEAGWAPEPVWTQRLEEISLAPAGYRTPIARSSSPWSDTILPELPRLFSEAKTSWNLWRDWEKPRYISDRIAGLQAEIWNRDLQSSLPSRSVNHSTTMFGPSSCCFIQTWHFVKTVCFFLL
jgi:hypothetical protein